MDGVAQTLGEHGLTGVGRETQLEETRLGCGETVHGLQGKINQEDASNPNDA